MGSREVPARRAARQAAGSGLRWLDAADRDLYAAIAAAPAARLDEPVRRLSQAANYSRIWMIIAAALFVLGGPPGRRAALRGLLAVGITSAAVNIAIKAVHPRERPDRAGARVPSSRQVVMPASTSFPSGHSASAFAFAAAAGQSVPRIRRPLHVLAGAVAYSRVHTGVHYPGDVLVGSIIGAAIGRAVGRRP